MSNRIFTSESVTEGHPDKICDQISDGILDDILTHDPEARVACETFVTTGMAQVMGEITTKYHVDIPAIVRETIRRIGYTDPEYGFDYRSCAVMTAINAQSPDIAMGVNKSYEHQNGGSDPADLVGAGDQGMMFGYACDETPELMPAPIALAHALTRRLAAARKSGELKWLRPDGKSQVTVEYDEAGKVLCCPAIVVSAQHDPDVGLGELREAILETVIKPAIPAGYIDKAEIYINPTGRFVVGGPVGDTGLTGRKIIVDTYGGMAGHGGGCFSGKDPTKVDRSGAYMARYIAKNLVAAGLCRKCQIEVAYAIGVANPVSIHVNSYGTGGTVDDERLAQIVRANFDLRPAKIIEKLELRRPIYQQTAAYGHFGRTDLDLPWERTDMAEALKG